MELLHSEYQKNRSQIWLETVCSLSCGNVFKDILATFVLIFLRFRLGLLIILKGTSSNFTQV